MDPLWINTRFLIELPLYRQRQSCASQTLATNLETAILNTADYVSNDSEGH